MITAITDLSGHPNPPGVPPVTPVPYAAMKASLVFDEFGVGRTPCGKWMYFTPKGGDTGTAPDSKEERRGWIDLASLVFNDLGVGLTDCGNWMWFPPLDHAEVTPGSAEGRTGWVSTWFEEDGEAARDIVGVSSSSEEEKDGDDIEDKDMDMSGTGASVCG